MSESSDKTTPQEAPPKGGPFTRLKPMKPDDPRRLGKDQEVLVFMTPREGSQQAS
jgi:hypothetical protein